MKPSEISLHPENSVQFDPTEFTRGVRAASAADLNDAGLESVDLPQIKYANESDKMWSFRHRWRAWARLKEQGALAGLNESDPAGAEKAALAAVAVLPLDFLGNIDKNNFRREVRRRLERA